jgi:predicted TIM-barrel fold metal-dependent hydrolase
VIIDAHNHIGERRDLQMSAERLIRLMDRAGVDKAVVFSFPKLWDNDYVARAVRQFPDRLIGFVGVNPWEASAADQVRRGFEHLGMRGLKLHPVRDSYSLAEGRLVDPLFRVCEEFGRPVLCHGADEWSNTPWAFREVAGRFPQIPFIMAHGGQNWLREDALDALRKTPNLYVDTSVMYTGYVRRVAQEISPTRLLMGTDTPTEVFEYEMKKIETAIADRATRQLVMGENIAKLIGVDMAPLATTPGPPVCA